MRLIEIGASHSPLVPKSAGWNTVVVDHASREGLIAKYGYTAEQQTVVEPVDLVWTQGALHDAFAHHQHGSFDAIVASHVLEHLPNPVLFLRSCEVLLKRGGKVLLALPDKRRCFDFFGGLSTTGDWIENFLTARAVHTARTAFNDAAYSVSNDGAIGWGEGKVGELRFVHPFDRGNGCALRAIANPASYFDHHAWRFVPPSFALIMLELAALNYVTLRVAALSEAMAQEFFATLVKEPAPPLAEADLQAKRMTLLRASIEALALQAVDLYDGASERR
jgi:SAM-dependent methyltransferase